MEFAMDVLNTPLDYTAAEFALHAAKQKAIHICSSVSKTCEWVPLVELKAYLGGGK